MGWTKWEKVSEHEFTDIIYEKKCREEGGNVARISFNRPKILNAFTGHTCKEVREALYDASHDRDIGVVVLTGVGNQAFSTGGDVSWESGGGTRLAFFGGGELLIDDLVRACRKPVIAAVKGYAIGGGHHLAYCCDFTIAADNAIFGQTGSRVGSPADGWYIPYLVQVVGAKRAREIWLLTREYSAQQALEMGLVNKVVPLDKLDEEVDKWCEEVLDKVPSIIEIMKATFNAAIEPLVGINRANLLFPDIIDGPEVKEAQQAFFEKRKPNFWKIRKSQTDAEIAEKSPFLDGN